MIDKQRIKIGFPLDLLLDRQCKLSEYEDKTNVQGGIIIPQEGDAGTGNIVIRGRPGTGKSILALQIAQRCCKYNSSYFSCFVALEETPKHVMSKAEKLGWFSYLKYMGSLSVYSQNASPKEYGESLSRALTRPDSCPLMEDLKSTDSTSSLGTTSTDTDVASTQNSIHKHQEPKSHVLLCRLSPRDITLEKPERPVVFAERYAQLERLLIGAKSLRDQGIKLELKIVCIDSLNVFGDGLLNREEIYRLFDLFKRYQTIGVFVLEEDTGRFIRSEPGLHEETIEYLADVVIALTSEDDSGYFVRYFEIVKSRYQHQVYGKHPFKIIRPEANDSRATAGTNVNITQSEDTDKGTPKSGVVIFPSLHYIVYGTEHKRYSRSGNHSTENKATNNLDSQ